MSEDSQQIIHELGLRSARLAIESTPIYLRSLYRSIPLARSPEFARLNISIK
jgi:hypothetical protein